ncbi:Uncharacterised protein [uncultured archaeon]|nr:Uncharacterised protein [uncultured archaeon]
MIDMKEIILSKRAVKRITTDRLKEVEHELSVKIKREGEFFEIDGEAINEWIAENVLQAIGMGFLLKDALKLKNDEYYLEKSSISEYFGNKEKLVKRYSARLIGRNGTVKKNIESLTDVKIIVDDEEDELGLIGTYEDLKVTKKAIQMIFEGLNHATVFKFLERKREANKFANLR